MRPSWICAPRDRAVSRCSSASSSRPRSTASRPRHDPDDDGGEAPHVGVVDGQAGLGLVPPAELVEEAGGQAVEQQGRDLELGGAAEVGRGRRPGATISSAPPVLGQDAPEVDVRAGHVGHVPVALGQLSGEVQLGEGAVGVAGRLECHAEGMAGVALVEGRARPRGRWRPPRRPTGGPRPACRPAPSGVGVGGQHPRPGRAGRRRPAPAAPPRGTRPPPRPRARPARGTTPAARAGARPRWGLRSASSSSMAVVTSSTARAKAPVRLAASAARGGRRGAAVAPDARVDGRSARPGRRRRLGRRARVRLPQLERQLVVAVGLRRGVRRPRPRPRPRGWRPAPRPGGRRPASGGPARPGPRCRPGRGRRPARPSAARRSSCGTGAARRAGRRDRPPRGAARGGTRSAAAPASTVTRLAACASRSASARAGSSRATHRGEPVVRDPPAADRRGPQDLLRVRREPRRRGPSSPRSRSTGPRRDAPAAARASSSRKNGFPSARR